MISYHVKTCKCVEKGHWVEFNDTIGVCINHTKKMEPPKVVVRTFNMHNVLNMGHR